MPSYQVNGRRAGRLSGANACGEGQAGNWGGRSGSKEREGGRKGHAAGGARRPALAGPRP